MGPLLFDKIISQSSKNLGPKIETFNFIIFHICQTKDIAALRLKHFEFCLPKNLIGIGLAFGFPVVGIKPQPQFLARHYPLCGQVNEHICRIRITSLELDPCRERPAPEFGDRSEFFDLLVFFFEFLPCFLQTGSGFLKRLACLLKLGRFLFRPFAGVQTLKTRPGKFERAKALGNNDKMLSGYRSYPPAYPVTVLQNDTARRISFQVLDHGKINADRARIFGHELNLTIRNVYYLSTDFVAVWKKYLVCRSTLLKRQQHT